MVWKFVYEYAVEIHREVLSKHMCPTFNSQIQSVSLAMGKCDITVSSRNIPYQRKDEQLKRECCVYTCSNMSIQFPLQCFLIEFQCLLCENVSFRQ